MSNATNSKILCSIITHRDSRIAARNIYQHGGITTIIEIVSPTDLIAADDIVILDLVRRDNTSGAEA